MKGEKGTEKDREGDFTCIPEATVEMEIYLVLVYVLSLTSKGCHGNQASNVGWARGIGTLSCSSSAVLLFISIPAALMCKEDLSWEMKKDDWLFVFQQGLNCIMYHLDQLFLQVGFYTSAMKQKKKYHFCFSAF